MNRSPGSAPRPSMRSSVHTSRAGRPAAVVGIVIALACAGCGATATSSSHAAAPSSTSTSTSTASSTSIAASASTTDAGATTTTASLPGTGRPPVTIGDKNFTEQFVLGELYRQALQAQGFSVQLNRNIGPTDVTLQAL